MKPTNQVLHLMGDHLTVRQKSFRIAYMDICRVSANDSSRSSDTGTVARLSTEEEKDVSDVEEDDDDEEKYDDEGDQRNKHTHRQQSSKDTNNKKLKHQLGLDQKTLLAIILHDYRKEIDSLIQSFKARMINTPSSPQLDSPSNSNSLIDSRHDNDNYDNYGNDHTNSNSSSDSKRGYNDFNQVTQLNSAIRRYCEGLDHVEATWKTAAAVPASSSSSSSFIRDSLSSPLEAFRQGRWTLLDEHLYQSNSDLIELLSTEQQQQYHHKHSPHTALPMATAVSNQVGLLGRHPESADSLRQTLHELFVQNLQASEYMQQQMKTKGK